MSIYIFKFLAIEVCIGVNNLNPSYLNDVFTHKNIDYDLRDKNKVEQPKFDQKIWPYIFYVLWVKLWNTANWC